MGKPSKCRADKPHLCRYHGALASMERSAAVNDVQGYLKARAEAEAHAHDDERSWLGRQLTSLDSHVESRDAFVKDLNKSLNTQLALSPSSNVLYVNPDLSEEERARVARVQEVAKVLSGPVADRSAREFAAAYSSRNFGREAEFIHPEFKKVDANLVGFEPENKTHEALVGKMVSAVVDQRYATRLASGEEMSPLEQALNMEYPESKMVTVKPGSDVSYEASGSVEDRSPETEFNHGWLYSFYEAVGDAKWDRSSNAYPSGGVGDVAKVEYDFVVKQRDKWEHEYEKNPTAFNDGAVSAWDSWLEDLQTNR